MEVGDARRVSAGNSKDEVWAVDEADGKAIDEDDTSRELDSSSSTWVAGCAEVEGEQGHSQRTISRLVFPLGWLCSAVNL